MPSIVVVILQYGVLGLCLYMIWHVGQTIKAEQKRAGQPRPGILTAAYVFMAFCIGMAVVSAYVQLKEKALQAEALDRTVTELRNQRDAAAEDYKRNLAERDRRISDQSADSLRKLEAAAVELAAFRRDFGVQEQRALAAEKIVSEERRKSGGVQRELGQLKEELAASGIEKNSFISESRLQREEIAKRDGFIRNVAAKFDLFATVKDDTRLVTMAAILVGIRADLNAFGELPSAAATTQLAKAEKDAAKLAGQAKAAANSYSVEHLLTTGQTFIDKLTGATLSITDTMWTFNGTRIFGKVTRPNGSTESIFGEPGAWHYVWNNRIFVLSVSHTGQSGTFKVNVQEATESATP